jgi:hypothetical protein
LRDLARQCHGNRDEIQDELYSKFQTLSIQKNETATNFTQKVIGQANEVRNMGRDIRKGEIRKRILRGIASNHPTYGGLILILSQNTKISMSTLQQKV